MCVCACLSQHIFFVGCAVHCLDLCIEDIAKIPEINAVIASFHFMTLFVKRYGLIFECFRAESKREYGQSAVGLCIYPLTRFAYAEKMIVNATKNKKVIKNIPDDPVFAMVRKKQKVENRKDFEKFELLAADKKNWQGGNAVAHILTPLSAMLHFLEGDTIPASFLIPLYWVFFAYLHKLPTDVTSQLSRRTIIDIKDAIKERWLGTTGTHPKVGLRADVHCLAFASDPYVRLLVKIVLGDVAQKDMMNSFNDSNCYAAIKNYCGGKTGSDYSTLISEYDTYTSAYNDSADCTNRYHERLLTVETVVKNNMAAHIAALDPATKDNKVSLMISCMKKLRTVGSAKTYYCKLTETLTGEHPAKLFERCVVSAWSVVIHACSVERINKGHDMIMSKVRYGTDAGADSKTKTD